MSVESLDASAVSALSAPLARMLASLPAQTTIAVALSGGPDSFALACCAAPLARQYGLRLLGFHVHHGLQAQADGWAEQVRALGRHLEVPVLVAQVDVTAAAALGVEAAAREARYGALAALASEHAAEVILLAHHQDDQAETVLLRLLRGSGPEALAAMAAQSARGALAYWRPWLAVPRQRIVPVARAYATQYGLTLADDPTNLDPRYTRAALRVQLAPVLDQRWRGWRSILARHAQIAAQQAEILAEVARDDLAALAPASDGSFSLAHWRALSPARQAHVLRYWLLQHGAQMPTQARLNDMLRQLRQLHAMGHDRRMSIQHERWILTCVRGRVQLQALPAPSVGQTGGHSVSRENA